MWVAGGQRGGTHWAAIAKLEKNAAGTWAGLPSFKSALPRRSDCVLSWDNGPNHAGRQASVPHILASRCKTYMQG